MSYFNRYLLGGYVAAAVSGDCTTDSDVFGDGSDLALYRFQGNAADDSGNNNNGTITNTAPSLTNGNFRGGVPFNGTSAYVDFGTLSIGGASGRTLSIWVKPASTQVNYAQIMDFDHSSGTAGNFTIQQDNNNVNSFVHQQVQVPLMLVRL